MRPLLDYSDHTAVLICLIDAYIMHRTVLGLLPLTHHHQIPVPVLDRTYPEYLIVTSTHINIASS